MDSYLTQSKVRRCLCREQKTVDVIFTTGFSLNGPINKNPTITSFCLFGYIETIANKLTGFSLVGSTNTNHQVKCSQNKTKCRRNHN